MRKNRARSERALIGAIADLISFELRIVSYTLYFDAVCEEDYPELADTIKRFGAEHSDNIKLLERSVASFGALPSLSIRTGTLTCEERDCESLIKKLIEDENEVALRYERIYLLDSRELFSDSVKKILRASMERLSMLETILKT